MPTNLATGSSPAPVTAPTQSPPPPQAPVEPHLQPTTRHGLSPPLSPNARATQVDEGVRDSIIKFSQTGNPPALATLEAGIAEFHAKSHAVTSAMDNPLADFASNVFSQLPLVNAGFKLVQRITGQCVETTKKNKVFSALAHQAAVTIQLLEEVHRRGERRLTEGVVLSLHAINRALYDAKDLLEKYGNESFTLNWEIQGRMKQEMLSGYSQLHKAIMHFKEALEADGHALEEDTEKLSDDFETQLKKVLDKDEYDEAVKKLYNTTARKKVSTTATTDKTTAVKVRRDRAGKIIGETPVGPPPDPILLDAYQGKFVKVYRKLLECGAEAKAQANNLHGGTYYLIHQAVFWESAFGVAILANFGADVNAQTLKDDTVLDLPAGSTPLHMAALLGNQTLIRLLLGLRAKTDIKDSKGHTPGELNTSLQCQDLLAICAQKYTKLRTAFDENRFDAAFKKAAKHGLSLDVRVNQTDFVIHHIAQFGTAQDYRILLNHGACPILVKEKNGKFVRPSEIARTSAKCQNKEFIELLDLMEREEKKFLDLYPE